MLQPHLTRSPGLRSNLAIDDDLRDRITESMGMEYSNRRGKRIAKSHLIAHVVSLLDEPELQDVTKRTMLSAKVSTASRHHRRPARPHA